jgi:cytoskeletal protein RodZ
MIKRLKNRAPVNTTPGNKSVSTVKDTPKKKKEKTAKLCQWRTFLMVMGVTLGISAFNNFLMTMTADESSPAEKKQKTMESLAELLGHCKRVTE